MRKKIIVILFTLCISISLSNDFEGYYTRHEGEERRKRSILLLKIKKLSKKKYEIIEYSLDGDTDAYKAKKKKGKLEAKGNTIGKLENSNESVYVDNGWSKTLFRKTTKEKFNIGLEEIKSFADSLKEISKVKEHLVGDGNWEGGHRGRLLGMMNPALLELNSNKNDELAFNVYGAIFGGGVRNRYSEQWSPGNEMKYFMGSVFGKSTRVSLKYDGWKEAHLGYIRPSDYNPKMQIIFEDIPSKSKGTSFSTIYDWAAPEVIESKFKGMEKWKPIFYYEKERCILFAEQKSWRRDRDDFDPNNGAISRLILFDLMNGNVKHDININNSNDYTCILSTYLNHGQILFVKNSNLTIEIYDVLNNITVEKAVNPIDNFKFSKDLSVDKSLWMYGSSGNEIHFIKISEDINRKKTIIKNSENEYLFEKNFGAMTAAQKARARINMLKGIIRKEELKIYNDLLLTYDNYNNILILNLNKGGIVERKFGVVQLKNDMLSDNDKDFLSNFNYNFISD